MGVKTLYPASTQKPPSQFAIASNIAVGKTGKKTGIFSIDGLGVALLRENFLISTWLLMGSGMMILLSFIFPRSYLAFPVVLILGWRLVDVLLIHFEFKKDRWAEDVIHGKWSIAYPSDGETQIVHGQPGENGPGAIMILGVRSNSSLGMFADGYMEVGDYFRKMVVQLEDKAEESGFMGMSNWIAAGERPANNEFATISYWRSVEDLHNFALSPVHREAWNWWSDTYSKHKNVGIMHEIFAVPERRGWEGIYANYPPTGLGRTTKTVESSEKGGQKMWINPIIDASRGAYRSSRGRMDRGDPDGKGNDSVAREPYTSMALRTE